MGSIVRTKHHKTRHYYSSERLFEKSFDIYHPSQHEEHMPIVLLVVGSGWMGHQWFVYTMTSWWNSAGPSTVAATGCTCVCIRHRGAFCHTPDWSSVVPFIALCGLVVAAVIDYYIAVLITLLIVTTLSFLKLGNRGSASFDDMLHDVAQAVAWVETNKSDLQLESDRKMVFGGYSSGGHVAATLLQRPQIWKQHGLPHPEKLFQGIIMISGVLAVWPVTVKLNNINNGSSIGSMNGHSNESMGGRHTNGDSEDTVITVGHNKPRWLTDLVMKSVWGPAVHKIPSPVTGDPPRIPHLLIENRHEVFGLQWLDIFFCADAFAARIAAANVRAIYRQVHSDHWNILASRVLHEALVEELPKLIASK